MIISVRVLINGYLLERAIKMSFNFATFFYFLKKEQVTVNSLRADALNNEFI